MPQPGLVDLIGTVLGALLTAMVLSFIFGDNPLFRFSMYLFIGVASGYAGALAWHQILAPELVQPVLAEGWTRLTDFRLLVPWALVLLLLLKVWSGTARGGTPAMAFLVGVAVAVILGGAVTGTLLPQARAAMLDLRPGALPVAPEAGAGERLEVAVSALVMLAGTIGTLAYFRFAARVDPGGEVHRARLWKPLAAVGRVFIGATFGAMYAGALAAAIVILTDRVAFIVDAVVALLPVVP